MKCNLHPTPTYPACGVKLLTGKPKVCTENEDQIRSDHIKLYGVLNFLSKGHVAIDKSGTFYVHGNRVFTDNSYII